MLVVNQTWMRPTVVGCPLRPLLTQINNSCHLPIVDVQSFFATHLFSIAQLPTTGIIPLAPTGAYTTWAKVTTALPKPLPGPPHTFEHGEKVAVGVGVALAVLGVLGILLLMWWIKRRRFLKAEVSR